MSSGQMALVIGAFMMFGVVNINLHDITLRSSELMDSNSEMQTAVTIGRSMLDEITQKPFDAVMATKKVVRLTDLTSCGSGNGEYYPSLNDVDDFEGKTFTSPTNRTTTPSSTPRALWGTEGYTVSCRVQYVDPNNPENTSSGYTWAKRVTIRVTNRYSQYPLTMTHVVTY